MKQLLVLLALSASTALAQGDRATITGTVTDQAGAAIPAVMVTATHLDTMSLSKVSTNQSGEYSLPSLPTGKYKVLFELPGFKSSVHNNVDLEAGATDRVDAKLEIGNVQQSVEVIS